jgi:hypothetical protein
MRSALGAAWRAWALAALAQAGCAPPASPPLPTQAEWTRAREWWGRLRASEPTTPSSAVVHVSLREPHTGRTFDARGAVAVDPHRALRMILVGPGGGTALDVWATHEHWRFEVPPLHLLRRGGRDDDASVPIGFFRWWFLAPLEGRLLTSVLPGARAQRLVLRSGPATVDVTDSAGADAEHVVVASRLVGEILVHLELHGSALGLSAGDRTVYDEPASGVHVEVSVESTGGAPDVAAFDDPDLAAGASGPS